MLRIVDGPAVASVLTVDMAIDAMETCFAMEADGRTGAAARVDLPHSSGWMRVLPAVIEDLGVFGHKVISFNPDKGVRYVVTVFDIAAGGMVAVVDAESITGARTGATAAVAADRMCRTGISRSAIIGTGSVARTQLTALEAVRPVDETRVYSRSPENRRTFIAEMQPLVAARLVECTSVDDAVDGADLVTLATKTPNAVFGERHLQPGMHVNSVGSARPPLHEVEAALFSRFDHVVCDSVELVFAESGDAIAALDTFDVSRARDLAQVLGGIGRKVADTTLFKSSGTGAQDLALTMAVLGALGDDASRVVPDPLTLKAITPAG